MSILNKLENADPRFFIAILFISIALPLIFPIGLPIPVQDAARVFARTFDAVPANGVIILQIEPEASMFEEVWAGAVVIVRHAFEKNTRVIIVSFMPDGPFCIRKTFDLVQIPSSRKYGQDWAYFAYIAGGESAIAAYLQDMHKTAPIDIYGTPVEKLPVMANIHSAKDVDLAIEINTAQSMAEMTVRQWYAYKIPLLMGTTAALAPVIQPYYPNSGLSGYVNGVRGAAELETIFKQPGLAVSFADALTTTQLLIVASVIVGNIAYFASRRTRK